MEANTPPGERPPRTMTGVVAASNEYLAATEAIIDAAIARRTDFARLAATCLARAAQSLMSVTHLAQLGLIGDSMSVARTIVELTIDLGYIATDPDRLIPMFIDYAHVRNWELAQAADRLHGGTFNRDAMQVLRERHETYVEQNPNSDRNWAGRGLRWRAERVAGTDATRAQHVQLYELLYADMCGASHSGYTTLKYTLVGEPNAPTIHFGPIEPDSNPIMLAFTALLNMIKTTAERCELEGFEDRFNRLNQLLLDAGR